VRGRKDVEGDAEEIARDAVGARAHAQRSAGAIRVQRRWRGEGQHAGAALADSGAQRKVEADDLERTSGVGAGVKPAQNLGSGHVVQSHAEPA